jgi:glycosyltransferase involved in cell wall biosynthesis
MENLVSIITPTFNSEPFIIQTIQSVQNQTHTNWEMIIVDDCSTDNTASLVYEETKHDSRIKFFQLKSNSGAGVARNYAINRAKGKYVAFLDSDDLWKPEKLHRQISFLNDKKLPFTFSFYDCIDEQGKKLNRRIETPLELTYRQLFFCNYVGNLTGIYDTEYFGKIPINSIRKRQDWMMWLTILKKLRKAHVVPESLAFYRIRKESISASKIDLIKYNFKIYRKFHQINFLGSVFCMTIFLFTQIIIKPRFVKKLNSC